MVFLQGYTGDGFCFLSFGANSALKILPRYFLTVSYFITNGFELFVVCKRWSPITIQILTVQNVLFSYWHFALISLDDP